MNNVELTPAQLMEAEEQSLVRQERCDDFLELQAIEREQTAAEAEAEQMEAQSPIRPDVVLNTEQISECHEPTSADEMEAEERDLVIEDSVDDTLTYAQKPLSDEEIRQKALTRLEQIDPHPKDGKSC